MEFENCHITSKERVDYYIDRLLVPKDWKMIYLGQKYTEDEVIEKAKDAEGILVDAILPVTRRIIENLTD
ncbi:MAG: hypothetical protein Q8930_18525 [Bacillota bacterium]|nr:hypothetical protein [Bacillota bacterium]